MNIVVSPQNQSLWSDFTGHNFRASTKRWRHCMWIHGAPASDCHIVHQMQSASTTEINVKKAPSSHASFLPGIAEVSIGQLT